MSRWTDLYRALGAFVAVTWAASSAGAQPSGWFDVTTYGARPDDGQPDGAAIQSAIDAAEAAGGGTVYLPRGAYRLERSLQLHRSGVTLTGDGIATKLYSSGVSEAMIQSLSIDRPQGGSLEHVIIEKLRLDGVDRSVTGIMASGLTRGSVIRDVKIERCRDGIDLSGCWSMAVERNDIFDSARAGILLGEGNLRVPSVIERGGAGHRYNAQQPPSLIVNAVLLIGNTARRGAYGIRWGGGNGWLMAGNTFELNQQNAYLRTTESGAVLGNYFEVSEGSDSLVKLGTSDGTGMVKHVVFGGNMIFDLDAGVNGIQMLGVLDTQFLTNRFSVGGVPINEPANAYWSPSVRSRVYGNAFLPDSGPRVPASANAPGVVGQTAWDTGYVYVCVRPNTWKRFALESW